MPIKTKHANQTVVTNRTIDELNERIRVLIATHPTPGVKTEFYNAIDSGEVIIAWTDDYISAFMLAPKSMLVGSGSQTKDLQPTLMVKQRLVTGDKDYAQLVLFHEYIHFKQWKYKTLPEDTFLLEPIDSSADDLADRCMKKWRAELEAYHKECEFALQAHTSDLLPFCAYIGTQEYKWHLFEAIKEGDKTMEFCSPVLQIH